MKIALCAGESSGDLLGGLLIDGLKQHWPEAQFVGIGGSQMKRRGFDAWWPSEKLAVRGYIEVLKAYPELLSIRRALKERLLVEKPDVFIGIDAPDFNLDLERDLKAAGVRTVHFISPSIWAWRPERIEKIRHCVDHMLCIFPFEKKLYDAAGIAATYVGHPLAGVIPMQPDRAAARQALGLQPHSKVIALLPGSRKDEIKYLGKRFLDAFSHFYKAEHAQAAIECIVPCVPHLFENMREKVRSAGLLQQVKLLQAQSHTALAACDVALVASGTATLETALFKRPMVIAYNMNVLSYHLMRRKQMQAWIGLPNILSGEFVVPELLQNDANAQNMADALRKWFHSPEKIKILENRFTDLHQSLLLDTPKIATHAIEEVIRRR